jgi:putative hydrolase of the HAD superfamily
MANIKNIIFDLGGVLLDIDTGKTNAAFAQLGISDFKNNYSLEKMDRVFENLETGRISEGEFYNSIKSISKTPITNSQIKDAWNALLLNFRKESLAFLETISPRYNLFLLSNTNSIHLTAFSEIFKSDAGKANFNDYFVKAYYSNIVGLRKPDEEIYSFVLQDAGIKAAETLFIDDLAKNIEAAGVLGIQTHLLLPHERIENLKL